MRVLLVSGSYPPIPDGVGDYTEKVYLETQKQMGEKNVALVTRTPDADMGKRPGVHAIIRTWNLWGGVRTIAFARSWKPDVVHLQYPATGYGRSLSVAFLPLLARIVLPGVRIVLTIHEYSNRTLKGRARLLISMLASHGIIVVNELYKKDITRHCPFLGKRIVYIPIGSNILRHNISREDLRKRRSLLGWGEDDPVLAYFGLLRAEKGIEGLLDVFYGVKREFPHARLLVIGGAEDTLIEDDLKSRVVALGLAQDVVVTGYLPAASVSEHLLLSDVCVLPFPDGVSAKRSSFITAIEHGLPVVTTNPACPIRDLKDGENVFLAPVGDTIAMVCHIKAMLDSPELRKTLSSNAAQFSRTFAWESIVAKSIEQYRKVCGHCS